MTDRQTGRTGIQNWIFVTGAPRSGTTFAGMQLSRPLAVDYIHEPFNPVCGLPGVETPYRYIGPGSASAERTCVDNWMAAIRDYNFSLKNNVPARDSLPRKLAKRVIGSLSLIHI